jgi:serine/threonine protein kinase
VSKVFKHKNAKQAEMVDRMIFKDPKDRINSLELLSSNLISNKSDEEILHDSIKILKLPKSSVAFKKFISNFFDPN